MRLTDIVSHLGLTFFPILGLFLFLAVFIGQAIRVMRAKNADMNDNARIPLDDFEPVHAVADAGGARDGGAA